MTGARTHSLANILTITDDYINPSIIIDFDSDKPDYKRRIMTLGVNNNFMISEISTMLAGFRMTNGNNDFSVLITRYGYQHFNETVCGLSVGRVLGKGLSLGVRLNYYRMDHIDNEENIFAIYPDIGLTYQPVENIILSLLITNPFTITYHASDNNYYLPFSYSLGFAYGVSRTLDFFFEVEKSYNIPFCFKSAFSWKPLKRLNFNIGYLTEPRMPTAGIGIKIRHMRADFSCQYHTVLGFSPSVSLSYIINR